MITVYYFMLYKLANILHTQYTVHAIRPLPAFPFLGSLCLDCVGMMLYCVCIQLIMQMIATTVYICNKSRILHVDNPNILIIKRFVKAIARQTKGLHIEPTTKQIILIKTASF